MAKSGVYEGDPVTVAKAVELKKELQRLVRTIVEDDDISVERIDKAHKTLLDLRELKLMKKKKTNKSVSLQQLRYDCDVDDDDSSQEMVSEPVPDHFICPLSNQIMKDPVIVSTGQTYDRPFILKYLKSGNRTCPRTQQVLSHSILTPNHLIRELIAQWCKARGIKLPEPSMYTDEEGLTEADREHFVSLVEKMSSTLPNRKEAAKTLRQLTKRTPSFRALFGENPTAITQLLSPLTQSKSKSEVPEELQEDIITTLLNLSIHDNNKKLVAETPSVILLLLDALRSGTIETRSNAAATLFTLSAIDSNKALIGKSGAFKPLLVLLDEGHPLAMKDVASAIFNLCILQENRARAVADGAVEVILKKIISRVHVDELLAILAMLSTSQRAIEEMSDLGAVPCLLSIIRETPCPRNKENCIAILHTICFSDPTTWKEMKEDENLYKTISQLAENGTSRAKRKANGILDRLKRIASRTHTA